MSDIIKQEKIGSVSVDFSLWPGTELYSDGPIETELLRKFEENPDLDLTDLLMQDDRYALLYHLSRERENILSWYPFSKDMDVLEVGSGCGALTGLLARQCRHVTALDLSLTRSKINAWRHRDAENLSILVRNMFDLPEDKQYDIITLIGVFEYSNLFSASERAFDEVLALLRMRLKPSGRLLIAIENRLGLKYLSGAREDHLWRLYSGLEGYPPKSPTTFTRDELTRLLHQGGFAQLDFFYPFPDYKFPRQIFSEKGKQFWGQLHDFFPNYGEYVYEGANQAKVFHSLRNDRLFSELSNAFFVDAALNPDNELPIRYVQIASQRDDSYALQTIFQDEAGEIKVIKKSLSNQPKAYLDHIVSGAKKLSERSRSLRFVDIEQRDDSIATTFLPHNTLAAVLAHEPQREKLLDQYYDMLLSLATQEPCDFTKSDAFQRVFGVLEAPPMVCIFPAPIDLVFDNILVDSTGAFQIIDTEWVFDTPVPLDYVLWRSAYQLEESRGISSDTVLRHWHVDQQQLGIFQRMEAAFSEYVFTTRSPKQYNLRYQSRKLSLANILYSPNGPYASILLRLKDGEKIDEQIVLFDHDREINEQTFVLDETMAGQQLRYTPLRGRMCRIIPLRIAYDDLSIDPAGLQTNASSYAKDAGWNFETYDPYILLPPIPVGAKHLRIQLRHVLFYDPDVEKAMDEYRTAATERDFYLKAYNNASEELKKNYEKQDSLFRELADKDSEVKRTYEQRDELYENLSEKEAELKHAYAQRDELYENLSEKEAELKHAYAQRDKLYENLSEKEAELKHAYAQRDKLYENLSEKEAELKHAYAQRDKLYENLSEKEAEMHSAYAQRDELYENLSAKNAEIENVYAQREALYANLSDKETEIASLNLRQRELSEYIAQKETEIEQLMSRKFVFKPWPRS